ncbi:MAG: PEGA domain-containing protein [Deltaproteobacteria bacterium]|nr:PEGA domain-containing protein [Deltaproteobacteria bacterium]
MSHSIVSQLIFGAIFVSSLQVQAGKLRVAVFTVPEDDAAVPAKVQIDNIFRNLLKKSDGFELVGLDGNAAKEIMTLGKRAVLQAKSLLEEAKESFSEQMYEDAIPDAEKAAAILERAIGITNDISPYLETLSILGTSRIFAGQTKLGMEVLTRLAMLDRTFPVPSVLDGEKQLKKAFNVARKRAARIQSCTLKVTTSPPGAKIFLDGSNKGFAPLKVRKVREGLHIIGAVMAGYKPFGGPAVFSCSDGMILHRIKLEPSPATREIQAALGAVLADLDEPRMTESAMALAERLDVGWLVVGMVKRATNTVNLDFHLYSMRCGDKLRRKRVAIPLNNDYLDALRGFAAAFFKGIQEGKPDPEIIQARTPKPRPARTNVVVPMKRPRTRNTVRPHNNPVTRKTRTRKNKTVTNKKKKKKEESEDSGDPLDTMDGTEDW